MSTTAKAHEPTMEEILASIRRIIADDEPGGAATPSVAAIAAAQPAKPAAAKPAAAKPVVVPNPEPEPEAEAAMNQSDIDAMLANFDAPSFDAPEPEPKPAKKAPADEDDFAAAVAEQEDVLDLKGPVAAPEAKKPSFPHEIEFREPEPAPKAEKPRPVETPSFAQEDAEEDWSPPKRSAEPASRKAVDESLLAPEVGSLVASAFGSLSNTLLSTNSRTLEELVQDMLRPMLKGWLDDNLPTIVERLVRAEIERVSRGPRR